MNEPIPMQAEVIPPPGGFRGYAGFWLRVVAFLIDAILLNVTLSILFIPLAAFTGMGMMSAGTGSPVMAALLAPSNLLGIVMNWLYYTLMESSAWQATIGKKLLNLKVTDMTGSPVGFAQANVRYWSKILSGLILFIGFIMVGFTERRQGLHDIIAKTLVIKA